MAPSAAMRALGRVSCCASVTTSCFACGCGCGVGVGVGVGVVVCGYRVRFVWESCCNGAQTWIHSTTACHI